MIIVLSNMLNFPDKQFKSCIPQKKFKDLNTQKIVDYFQSQEYMHYKQLKQGMLDPDERVIAEYNKQQCERHLVWIFSNIN